jgi:hypothetical protein
MKYDPATTRVGLKAVTKQVLKIIDSDGEKVISECFCSHLIRAGRLVIRRGDEKSTVEVSKNLANFAKSTAEKGLEEATMQSAKSLGDVVVNVARDGLGEATMRSVMSFLEDVGMVAIENGLEEATKEAVYALREGGKAAAGKRFEGATLKAAEYIGDVGKAAEERGFEDVTRETICSLRAVGKAAAGKRFEDATYVAVEYIGYVGRTVAEGGFEEDELFFDIIDFEGRIMEVVYALWDVGKAAIEKRLENATESAVSSLGTMGKAIINRGDEDSNYVLIAAAEFTEYLGKAAIEKGVEGVTGGAAGTLISIGNAATERGFNDKARVVACFLARLTALSKENVESVIHYSRLALGNREKDLESFRKFMKIYEQELDKRRAEKRTANIS